MTSAKAIVPLKSKYGNFGTEKGSSQWDLPEVEPIWLEYFGRTLGDRLSVRTMSGSRLPNSDLKQPDSYPWTRNRTMHKNLLAMALAAFAVLGLGMVATGDDYSIVPIHSGVVFKISHSDINWVYGRFNEFSGDFAIDPSDPSKSSFTMTIKPESVNTNSKKRDGHLRSPDFFNTKQFPDMKFTSTAVKPIDGGLEVTGNFTMHGETKPVTFNLMGGKTVTGKMGPLTGYTAEFKLKRSDFGISKFPDMLGDDVSGDGQLSGAKKR